jgi:transposase
MLTMEQIYRIRNMKKFEGKSLRKISRITGHDFETVKKYVEKEDFNQTLRPKQRRQGKLSPYRSIVTAWLINDKKAPHKQQHTAKRVYDRLKELYGAEFDASERSVRKLVAEIRKGLEMDTNGFLPLEHPPGEAQADFGEARFIENGIAYDGYYLNIAYPLSKRPTALKYTGLYSQLPQILKEYLDKSDYERKKQTLKLFAKMTATTGIDTAIEAFEEGLKLGVSDPDSIWATYCRLTTGTLPEPEIPLPDKVSGT